MTDHTLALEPTKSLSLKDLWKHTEEDSLKYQQLLYKIPFHIVSLFMVADY